MSLKQLTVFAWFAFVSITILSTPAEGAKKPKYTNQDVKCHVCRAVVREMKDDVAKVHPGKTVEVGGYRLDSEGNAVTKTVPMAKSEVYLTELMDNVCKRMEDYVKATRKTTGEFTLHKIMINGAMNPETSNVDIVQDDDLNRSLSHYCLEVVEDLERTLLNVFQAENEPHEIENYACSVEGHYCASDDYYEADRDLLDEDYHEHAYNEEL